MFFHVKENTLNEEKFLRICHECGYEPYLYDKRDDDKILSKKYTIKVKLLSKTIYTGNLFK